MTCPTLVMPKSAGSLQDMTWQELRPADAAGWYRHRCIIFFYHTENDSNRKLIK
jgi:hypothetical protein